MLKEITLNELINEYEVTGEGVYIIRGNFIIPAEKFFDELRVLLEVEEETEDEENEEEDEADEDHEPEQKNRKRMSKEERTAQIMELWGNGKRTPKEVAELAGCSLWTVYNCLPRSSDG